MKDGYGFSPFKDSAGNEYKYIFKEKPGMKSWAQNHGNV